MGDIRNSDLLESTDSIEPNTLGLEVFSDKSTAEIIKLTREHSSPNGSVKIKFQLTNIGNTNDPVNIAFDYLEALWIGERLSKHCKKTASETKSLSYYEVYVVFSMWPSDLEGWARELIQLTIDLELWSEDCPDGYDIYDPITKAEGLSEVEDNILNGSSKICLPELADCFIANYIHGTLYHEEEAYWNERFPTWPHGFWKSALSRDVGYDLYTSTNSQGAWIVMSSKDKVEDLLLQYGGFSEKGRKLYSAEYLQLNDESPFLVSDRNSVYAPAQQVEDALKCWRGCLQDQKRKSETDNDQHLDAWQNFSWRMTEHGQAVVASHNNVHFVVFCSSTNSLRPEQLQDILAKIENSADRLRQLVGLPPSSPCNWDSINEEDFEELCYDVIRRMGIFDERTIRKHGKTRSRDGGRDIEIWSRPRIGKPSIKWIFQCKYLSTSRSLGAGRIDMSDVVEQYGAGGFGVMTNSVIDSTLYDRMDAIATRRNLEIMTFSKLELERFITHRRDLLLRYFKHD
ncbi:hypothetical protein KYC5002_20130 [Archangium violaceum]|uniref:restriction endonuclease n=1 Tax=Archangium violaceum TaxID=83451 RepID=UPI002B2A40F6|nr:hypothetical protein KYC5002_20130 [Archangium gephyra]